MLIETTKGLIDEALLDKSVHTEDVPCGWSDTTTWRLNGEVVKQDVMIRVKEGILFGAEAGILADAAAQQQAERSAVKDYIASAYKAHLQSFVDSIGQKVRSEYPELEGLALSFDLPGITLQIKPKQED